MTNDFGSWEEDGANSSREEFFDPNDDEEEDYGNEDGQGNSERDEKDPRTLAHNEHHVPRVPWFITEKYTSTLMDNPNDMYLDNDHDHLNLRVRSQIFTF